MTSRSTIRWVGLSLAVLSAADAFALSTQVSDIFRKDRRELEPPPRSLRATAENSAVRYSNGNARLARKTDEEDENVGSASASLFGNDDEDAPEAKPRRQSYRARSTSMARRHQGFVGDRYFGLGFVGAGAYGVFGGEVEFGVVPPDWTFGFGVGTGMSFSTWGLHARYFLEQARWSPLVELGYAQWSLGRVPADGLSVSPTHLSHLLFEDRKGEITRSRTAHLIYPGIGVLYQHKSGLAALFELQYMISARNFLGALYGTFGFFFYF